MAFVSRAERPIALPTPETCPRCSVAYEGTPDRCPRCGAPLRVTGEELRRLAEAKRGLLRNRKTVADVFFLLGLLVGGPIMTLGGYVHTGALLVLAGGLASALRRYTEWSTPGTAVVGTLLAAVVASWIAEPHTANAAQTRDATNERVAYARALADKDPDILVEPRGPESTAIWFTLPTAMTGPCGAYPAPPIRKHLAQVGFRRIVVAEPNGAGGLCSFAP